MKLLCDVQVTQRCQKQWWRAISEGRIGDSNKRLKGIKPDIIYLKDVRGTERERRKNNLEAIVGNKDPPISP